MAMQFAQANRAATPDYMGAAAQQNSLDIQRENANQLRRQGNMEAAGMGFEQLPDGTMAKGWDAAKGMFAPQQAAPITDAAGLLGGAGEGAAVAEGAAGLGEAAALAEGAVGVGEAAALAEGATAAAATGAGGAGASGTLMGMGPAGWAALAALAASQYL